MGAEKSEHPNLSKHPYEKPATETLTGGELPPENHRKGEPPRKTTKRDSFPRKLSKEGVDNYASVLANMLVSAVPLAVSPVTSQIDIGMSSVKEYPTGILKSHQEFGIYGNRSRLLGYPSPSMRLQPATTKSIRYTTDGSFHQSLRAFELDEHEGTRTLPSDESTAIQTALRHAI